MLAQTSTDFWECFENITTITEFQNEYPSIAYGATQEHTLMNHGIVVPSNSDFQFQTNITVAVIEKNGVLNQNITEFFIIREAKFEMGKANFELQYYYDFAGNYEHFKTGSITLEKTDGTWAVINSTVE
jgi:hypothetical protein